MVSHQRESVSHGSAAGRGSENHLEMGSGESMIQSDYPLHRSVEISKMRRLMKYGLSEYREDWQVSIALAILMGDGTRNHFQLMLDSCFQRMQAFEANNPGVLPFEYNPQAEGAYDDMVKLCKEYEALKR
jgi:hypothetical protein